jgi:hypothetical protein
MRRTTPLLALLPLAFALGACGDDGGGGDEAFCAAVEDVEGEDTPTVEQLEEIADSAPSEIEDDVELLLDFLRAFEEGGIEELEDFDEEELDDAGNAVAEFAEDECGVQLDTSSEPSDDGSDSGDGSDDADDEETTTTAAGDEGDGGASDLGDPEDPPDTDDPTFAEHAEQCFDGDLGACDTLYLETPVGSPEEEYGATCGGRVEGSENAALCEQNFG